MIDDDMPARPIGSRNNVIAMYEEQSDFRIGNFGGGTGAKIRMCVDSELVRHSTAAVERLILLVARAVRASNDEDVARLDPILQTAERLLALAEGIPRLAR